MNELIPGKEKVTRSYKDVTLIQRLDKGPKIKLTDEEYSLLCDCLKWNLYFYREKVSHQNFNSPYQQEQIKKIEELNSKINSIELKGGNK